MTDNFLYGVIIVAYFFGAGLLRISPRDKRFAHCITISVLLYGLTLQFEAIYGLNLIFSVWLILKSQIFSPKISGYISFLWTFIYLGIFRVYFQSERMLELGLFQAGAVCNAFQLILTLRVSSFSIDASIPNSPASNASFVQYFSYCIFFMGAFTGPWVPYRVYQNSLTVNIPLDKKLIREKFIFCLGVLAVAQFCMKFFPKRFIVSDEFLDMGFVRQILYILISTTWFRCKFYAGWLLAEIAFVFGNVRQKDKKYPQITWGENVDLQGTELQTTISNPTRRWNLSVNSWLVIYVYKQVPGPKVLRSLVVMTVSGYWHGFEFGLYLWALGLWLGAMTESRLDSITKGLLPESIKKVLAFLLSYSAMSYGALAFFFKSPDDFVKILRYYNATSWIFFTGPIAIILACSIADLLDWAYWGGKFSTLISVKSKRDAAAKR